MEAFIESAPDFAVLNVDFTNSTAQALLTFADPTKGWNFGPMKIAMPTVNLALRLLWAVPRDPQIKTEAFPGRNGKVILYVYAGERSHRFTVKPNGKIEYDVIRENIEDGDSDEVVTLDISSATEKASQIAQTSWHGWLEYFPVGTTPKSISDSPAKPLSQITQMRTAFRSSTKIASPSEESQHVTTFKNFTGTCAMEVPSYYALIQKNYTRAQELILE